MNNNEQREPEVLTRVKKRISFRTTDERGGEVTNYTMLTLTIAAFSIGSWAMICLSKVIIDKGPLSIIRMLSEALMGK
mgnify:FL=1